jgi:hypothetical protein
MLRKLLIAMILILFTEKEIQLSLYLLLQILFILFLLINRPFISIMHNALAIINEIFLLVCISLMFPFFDDDEDHNEVASVIILIFKVDLIFLYLMNMVYEMYLLIAKCQNTCTTRTTRSKKDRIKRYIDYLGDHEERKMHDIENKGKR